MRLSPFASSLALATLVLAAAPSGAHAFPGLSAAADLGFGSGHVESAAGSTVTSWGLGVSLPLGPMSWVELRSTGTGSWFSHGAESSDPGSRAIQTLTTGFQLSPPLPITPFVGAGIGLGRAENAAERRPAGAAALPTATRTSLGYSLAVGYRFAGGLGPTHLEVAYRMHGLLDHQLQSSDLARMVTLGIHF